MEAEWAARQFQLVWFIPDRKGYSAYELFRSMLGQSPTSTNSGVTPPFAVQPGSHMLPGPFENAQGQLDGRAVNLSVQQQRIDVIVSPFADQVEENKAPIIYDVEKTFAILKAYVDTLAPIISIASRLGVTANYVQEHESALEANVAIMNCIGLSQARYSGSNDVTMNISRKSTVDGFEFNRIMRWQPESFTNMTLSFGPNGQLVPITSAPVYVAGLSIDINSVPKPELSFSPDQQTRMFSVLLGEGRRLWKSNSISALADDEHAR